MVECGCRLRIMHVSWRQLCSLNPHGCGASPGQVLDQQLPRPPYEGGLGEGGTIRAHANVGRLHAPLLIKSHRQRRFVVCKEIPLATLFHLLLRERHFFFFGYGDKGTTSNVWNRILFFTVAVFIVSVTASLGHFFCSPSLVRQSFIIEQSLHSPHLHIYVTATYWLKLTNLLDSRWHLYFV